MYKNSNIDIIIPSDVVRIPGGLLEHIVKVPGIKDINTRDINVLSIIGGSNLESTALLFRDIHANDIDLTNFDTGNVKNMDCMFSACHSALTGLDQLNTARVTDMMGMFYDFHINSTLDLSKFNTERAIFTSKMFMQCRIKGDLILSGLNMSNSKQLYKMFEGAYIGGNLYMDNMQLGSSRCSFVEMFNEAKVEGCVDLNNSSLAKDSYVEYIFGNSKTGRVLECSDIKITNTFLKRSYKSAIKSLHRGNR